VPQRCFGNGGSPTRDAAVSCQRHHHISRASPCIGSLGKKNCTSSAIANAKSATSDIPIVFFTGTDPVAEGLVESFSRPAGNLTGALRSASIACDRRIAHYRMPHCGITIRLTSGWGQKPRLPHCNIYNRFASLNGHNDGRASWSPAVADDV